TNVSKGLFITGFPYLSARHFPVIADRVQWWCAAIRPHGVVQGRENGQKMLCHHRLSAIHSE
ncbi:hypothetical protein, partial [Pantoea eucalypti]|uniref:hypothetical protein n=1 Tax=Pantoea eucalypti TaxID=470933 RepID=UPI00289B4344